MMVAKNNFSKFVISVVTANLVIPLAAVAEGFPGKGNASDWGDALPYYNQANKYLNEQRYDDAVRRYKDALSHYSFDPDFYTNLGVAYRKLGDFEEAEQALKASIQLDDKDWTPWSNLANVYLKQDKLKEAVATFERTLKCNPPNAERIVILQDIKDINKILSMQAPPKDLTAKQGSQSQSTGSSPRIKTKKNNNVVELKDSDNLQRTSTSNTVSGAYNNPSDLQNSGWDYVYKSPKQIKPSP
jgi:tetratricopeptide (TPR) repeat protein